MSGNAMEPFTADIERDATHDDDYGGERRVPGIVYAGIDVTFNFYQKDSTKRFEAFSGAGERGPGVLTRDIGVVIIDPWDGTVLLEVNDRVKPNPPMDGLPSEFKVIGVRAYPDGDQGELQLDVEVVL